jgi:hypothetical protein
VGLAIATRLVEVLPLMVEGVTLGLAPEALEERYRLAGGLWYQRVFRSVGRLVRGVARTSGRVAGLLGRSAPRARDVAARARRRDPHPLLGVAGGLSGLASGVGRGSSGVARGRLHLGRLSGGTLGGLARGRRCIGGGSRRLPRRVCRLEGRIEVGVGRRLEGGDADVADPVAFDRA